MSVIRTETVGGGHICGVAGDGSEIEAGEETRARAAVGMG